jgi:hypothetical protein
MRSARSASKQRQRRMESQVFGMSRPPCGCEREKGGVGSGVNGANARGWLAGTDAMRAPAKYSRRGERPERELERIFRIFSGDMRIFVDESGHPTVAHGSSPTFSLGAVLFERVDEAEECDQTVEQLKAILNVAEFHYVDLTPATRKAFLEAVCKHDFGYIVQTFVKKRRKHGNWAENKFFYDRIAAKFAEGIGEFLQIAHACRLPGPLNAKVVCDKGPDPAFLHAMDEHLRNFKDHRGRSLIEKLSSQRAVSNNLIQVADMVLGATVHPNHGHKGIIQKKQWVEQEWP